MTTPKAKGTHRCTSRIAPSPGESPPREAGLPYSEQCPNEAVAFFADKYGALWPRCGSHTVGWIRGGEPNPSDGAREISREEYEVALVQMS